MDAGLICTLDQIEPGRCDKLFEHFRALEHEYQGEYRVVVVGALMMSVGAKINRDDLEHLKVLANKIPGRHGFVSPIFDDGFRHPGKVQFLAALDNYQPGTPRDFREPRYSRRDTLVPRGTSLLTVIFCSAAFNAARFVQTLERHPRSAASADWLGIATS